MRKTKAPIHHTVILNARPGAGKSEIIKYLKSFSIEKRIRNFHIGEIHVIDDFPYLWRWFEEDAILEKMGKARLFSDQEGYFKYPYLWELLIQLINLEYEKFVRDCEDIENYTIFIEFSRGTQHGGYQKAYSLLSDDILNHACLLYLHVSWEESLRKNRQRFNPDKPDSILEHGIPDKKLEYMYKACDFFDLIDNDDHISINNKCIPYSIFDNDDDVTTQPTPELGERLKKCFDDLWEKKANLE